MNPGEERPPVTIPPQGTGHFLPEEYTIVPPVDLDSSKAVVPQCHTQDATSVVLEEKEKEEGWVRHSLPKLNEESVAPGDAVTWAAYYASNYVEDHPPASTALLPLTKHDDKARYECVEAGYHFSKSRSNSCNYCRSAPLCLS